jgi:hypothetical protein
MVKRVYRKFNENVLINLALAISAKDAAGLFRFQLQDKNPGAARGNRRTG